MADGWQRCSSGITESPGLADMPAYPNTAARRARAATPAPVKPAAEPAAVAAKKRGLTYGERLELEAIMNHIEAAEAEVVELEAELASTEFNARDYADQAAHFDALATARARAEALVERWSELESRR